MYIYGDRTDISLNKTALAVSVADVLKIQGQISKNEIFIGKLLKIWGQLSKNLSTTIPTDQIY